MPDNGVTYVSFEPSEDLADRDSDKWAEMLLELRHELEKHAPDDVVAAEPSADGKGVELVAVIAALGSAGAFTAVVEGLKAFLGRDGRKKVTVSTTSADGKKVQHEIDGLKGDQALDLLKSMTEA